MSKYKKIFEEMIKRNQELFDRFQVIHDKYAQNLKVNQQEFNEIGREVQDVVRVTENLLCSHSQNSGFGKFSTGLSEKFQAEVKAAFPKYSFIGLEQ